MILEALIVAALLPAAAGDMEILPGSVEGRPPAGQASPLQAMVDRAEPGATVEVGPGIYEGDLSIDRPLRLVGRGRPRLLGSGTGSVVRVRAAGVTVEGFDLDGRGGGNLARDSSGIHVAAAQVTIRDCRIEGALFGVYLRAARGARVERSVVRGIPGKEPGEKGSGFHVWNTRGFTLEGNLATGVRDGFYVQSSPGGVLRDNVARDLRYGLHTMYSDDGLFEDNTFENGAAGAALMYSRRLVFRRNRFVHNRGFASVGLLLKACDDVLAEGNLIADNARGLFLEGSRRNLFRGNVIAASDVAVVLYDSTAETRFAGNSFVANLTPLSLVGRRTDTVFAGNYFGDHAEPDLDGDGRSDRPYRLSSVFDRFRAELAAADLMAQGLGAAALGAAEASFPILEAVPVADSEPLVRPPAGLPRLSGGRRGPDAAGLAGSLALLVLGGATLSRGRRPA